MWQITLAVALALSALVMSNPAMSQGRGIHIFESSYGVRGSETQVTAVVAARCEGRYRCGFPVGNDFFGGDPAGGIVKRVEVR